MKIAIAHPQPAAVSIIKQAVQKIPDNFILWTASSRAEILKKCSQNLPDLLLLDLDINGVEIIRAVMQQSPCVILVMTDNLDRNIDKIYTAMSYGAIDAVNLPGLTTLEPEQFVPELLSKISKSRRIVKSLKTTISANSKTTFTHKIFSQQSIQQPISRQTGTSTLPLIAIGSSTGGPKALAAILAKLSPNFRAAIVIVQHVDAQFSTSFIHWLNQQTALDVRAAVSGDRFQAGTVLVAGNNHHLYLKSDGRLDYKPDPQDYPYRPSVDVFFQSLAQYWQHPATAILLTGMGRDGAVGLHALRRLGWQTIAQDKQSCAIFGMPKAATEINAAVEVLSPAAIAASLQRFSTSP
jgi:two-component system, chemotaxis family, response regulator WspF